MVSGHRFLNASSVRGDVIKSPSTLNCQERIVSLCIKTYRYYAGLGPV